MLLTPDVFSSNLYFGVILLEDWNQSVVHNLSSPVSPLALSYDIVGVTRHINVDRDGEEIISFLLVRMCFGEFIKIINPIGRKEVNKAKQETKKKMHASLTKWSFQVSA